MPHNTHDYGDLVRVSAEFRDAETEALIDPTAVKLSVRNPSGTVTTYTYGDDDALLRTETGKYEQDVSADEAGRWYYRWWSTGDGQAAEERSFEVRPAQAV